MTPVSDATHIISAGETLEEDRNVVRAAAVGARWSPGGGGWAALPATLQGAVWGLAGGGAGVGWGELRANGELRLGAARGAPPSAVVEIRADTVVDIRRAGGGDVPLIVLRGVAVARPPAEPGAVTAADGGGGGGVGGVWRRLSIPLVASAAPATAATASPTAARRDVELKAQDAAAAREWAFALEFYLEVKVVKV